MAIDVTCNKCHTRFQVSDKFAGKSGPCPKCKNVIKVPELKEQVVIHAPEVSGPTDSQGVAVLKPLERQEVKLQVPQIALIIGSLLVVLIVAVVLRLQFPGGKIPPLISILGAIALGPPLAFAGYTFLRDDELAPFRGSEVLLRSLACGLAWAAIWGAYWFVLSYLFVTPKSAAIWQPSWTMMAAVVPIMVAIGAFASQASFELELTTGALHYSMYLGATVILRLIMGMSPHWNR